MEGVWGMMEKPCVECAIIRGLMEEETCATFVHVVFDPVMLLVLTDDQLVSVNHSRTNVGRWLVVRRMMKSFLLLTLSRFREITAPLTFFPQQLYLNVSLGSLVLIWS